MPTASMGYMVCWIPLTVLNASPTDVAPKYAAMIISCRNAVILQMISAANTARLPLNKLFFISVIDRHSRLEKAYSACKSAWFSIESKEQHFFERTLPARTKIIQKKGCLLLTRVSDSIMSARNAGHKSLRIPFNCL